MTHILIDLPFEQDVLELYISKETLEYHRGIILLTGTTVIILGYYGGKITWPDKEPS
ncbi:hypothetical protein [Sulfurovum sp.]|uniref:hypothetical protein n=1 Tax=Sulfurovum sp. TaxID=1969726 RepID=UPI00286819BC|nr:hypothetical protein [Sulfurovum sp.]